MRRLWKAKTRIRWPVSDPKRQGILAGGNFITDYVKVIREWPAQDTLASIVREEMSNGGGPYNVLKDLAVLAPDISREACGLIGNDLNGNWIIDDCRQNGIEVSGLRRTSEASTSYTDAMTVESTGRRTFFHQRGANALLGPEHFSFDESAARIFHLGYLMLLDRLDELDSEGRSGAEQVLQKARDAGMITSVDCVSELGSRFPEIVKAALRSAHILFINEFECGQVLQREIAPEKHAMMDAARDLVAIANDDAMVVLHAANGAVVVDGNGKVESSGAVALPEEWVVGATGAGDAFAAGFLLGIHEGRDPVACLRYAVSSAAMSLSHSTPSNGMKPLANCLELIERYGSRPF